MIHRMWNEQNMVLSPSTKQFFKKFQQTNNFSKKIQQKFTFLSRLFHLNIITDVTSCQNGAQLVL